VREIYTLSYDNFAHPVLYYFRAYFNRLLCIHYIIIYTYSFIATDSDQNYTDSSPITRSLDERCLAIITFRCFSFTRNIWEKNLWPMNRVKLREGVHDDDNNYKYNV
jgi:hypothetical protein